MVRLFIAGSYISAKAEPGDIDLLVVYDPGVADADRKAGEYNIVHRASARRLFGHELDIYPVRDGSPAVRELLSFFQSNRRGKPVGIVEVRL